MDNIYKPDSIKYLNAVEALNYDHITVMLEKTESDQGYGIAISGGKDNSSQRCGDSSIIVSDVIEGSAADTLVRINDIILAINGVNVENVTHSYAVNLLRSHPRSVYLLLKRRKVVEQITERHPMRSRGDVSMSMSSNPKYVYGAPISSNQPFTKIQNEVPVAIQHEDNKFDIKSGTTGEYEEMTILLDKGKQGYGLYLGNLIFVKDKIEGTPAHRSDINLGDIIRKINDISLESCKSTDEVLDIIKRSGIKLKLDIIRPKCNWLPKPLTNKTYFYNTPSSIQVDSKKKKSSSFKTPRLSKYGNDESNPDLRDGRSRYTRSQSTEGNEVYVPPPLSKSYSSNRFDRADYRVQDNSRFQDNIRTKYTAKEEQYPTEQIMPIINDVHRRNYQRPRSSSTNAALSECRSVNLIAIDDQLGLQIIGGNKSGIFISSVMENGAADRVGLKVGDLIVMVNDVDFRHVTREEAVIVLLSFKNQPIVFKCINKHATYEKIRFQPGDDFYVRVNFDYTLPTNARELSLKRGELLHIRDTMYGGTIGSWSAVRISLDGKSGETGIVPNKNRAEQLSAKAKIEERKNKDMKRRLRRGASRQSQMNSRVEYQSQDKLDSTSFVELSLQLPAYEKVSKGQAYFKRPVVLLGAASDVFKEYLVAQLASEFEMIASKDSYDDRYSQNKDAKSIKLYQIQQVIEKDKHCLLDISEEGIQMLHHVNLSPIVILIKLSNRKFAREFRAAAVNMVYGSVKDKIDRREARNIYRFGSKIYKKFPMLITATIELFDQPVNEVYTEIINVIKARQCDPIFVSENDVDADIIDAVTFKGPSYESGFSSANDSFTDEDGDSVINLDKVEGEDEDQDQKVFRQNRYEHTQKIYKSAANFSSAEPIARGRKVNITYEHENEPSSDVKSYSNGTNLNLKSNLSSYTAKKQTVSSSNINSGLDSWDARNLELSLSTVLKLKVDPQGGVVECPKTKVSVYAPPGALDGRNKSSELFFKIYVPSDKSLNKTSSNKICPIVICGPSGTHFIRPIEIRIPFKQEEDGRLDVKIKICRNIDDEPKAWIPLPLDYPGAAGNSFKLSEEITAILVDRF